MISRFGCTVDPVYSHCFGSVITIGMRVSNDSNTPILGMALAATGYENDLASFSGGRAVDQVFAQVCIPTAGIALLLGLGVTGLAFGRSTRRLPADG